MPDFLATNLDRTFRSWLANKPSTYFLEWIAFVCFLIGAATTIADWGIDTGGLNKSEYTIYLMNKGYIYGVLFFGVGVSLVQFLCSRRRG